MFVFVHTDGFLIFSQQSREKWVSCCFEWFDCITCEQRITLRRTNHITGRITSCEKCRKYWKCGFTCWENIRIRNSPLVTYFLIFILKMVKSVWNMEIANFWSTNYFPSVSCYSQFPPRPLIGTRSKVLSDWSTSSVLVLTTSI